MQATETFGSFLAESREKSGYNSQRQLATASGLSNGTIARIEAGTQKASPETLKTLSEALRDVSYEELMKKAGYLQLVLYEDYRSLIAELDEKTKALEEAKEHLQMSMGWSEQITLAYEVIINALKLTWFCDKCNRNVEDGESEFWHAEGRCVEAQIVGSQL